MAFTTTRGESGVDFIGTDGVDALFVINEPENNVVSGGTGVITIDAKAGNDNVDLTNESGVTGNAEVKLGEGNDILTMGGNAVNRLNRLVDSFVNGGPGNDDITTEGTVSTTLRGNEGDDDFFLISNYTGTTINGNSGQDSFTLNGDVTLSDSKILGGSGNDGQMDFTNGSILPVDSVIQGGSGLDTISIGALTSGLSNFRVSGGKDNDTITVANTNGSADGAAYNGAAGEDSITFLAANAADAVSKGGDGNDRFTLQAQSGDLALLGEAGDDRFVIAGSGKTTVTGGAGSDTYNDTATVATQFVINSVSESAAATTGTAVTFDVFETAIDNTTFSDIIDLKAGGTGEALVGNRLNSDEVDNNGAIAAQVAGSFAALKTLLDNGLLTASVSNLGAITGVAADVNTGQISLQMVEVTGGTIDGFYAILNNTNSILDSGDMMFQMASTTDTGVGGGDATDELAEIAAAIEAGF